MATTLQPPRFTPEERADLRNAILFGVEGADDVDDLALRIAEALPALLRKCKLADTLENRGKLIELVLDRMSARTAAPSKSYPRFARGSHFRTKGRR